MEQLKPLAPPAPSPSPTVVRYIGYSCFLIVAPDGTRVVTDPYGCAVPNLPFPGNLHADMVTVSHGHNAHIQVHAVKGEPIVLSGITSDRVGMVDVASYDTLHGECNGRPMGTNTVFVFQISGSKIVHLGDLGRIESSEVRAAIKDADVVLAPTGEAGTMECNQLNDLLEQIGARTVVPHHFAVHGQPASQRMSTIARYVASLPTGTVIVGAGELTVEPDMPRQVALLSLSALAQVPTLDPVSDVPQHLASLHPAGRDGSTAISYLAWPHVDGRAFAQWQGCWGAFARTGLATALTVADIVPRWHPSGTLRRHKCRSH